MGVETVVALPSKLKEQFNKYTADLSKEGHALDQHSIMAQLISDYINGRINREKIQCRNRCEDVIISISIPGPKGDILWERFLKLCMEESKNPKRVIVDLIELLVNRGVKQSVSESNELC